MKLRQADKQDDYQNSYVRFLKKRLLEFLPATKKNYHKTTHGPIHPKLL